MKLLAIEISRVTALFRMTRPGGQPYLPHIAAEVAKRYRFGGAPRSLDEMEAERIEFRHGLFQGNAVHTLEVYNDGIVVSSRSDTDFIDEFIEDLVGWMENEHNLSMIETHTVNKMYNSTLLVEMNGDVFKPFEAYADILRMIETALRGSSGLDIVYRNYGLALSADQTRNPALKPIPFRIERKEGVDFCRNQFFATAPLKTRQHLEILERLEHLAR